MARRLLLVLLLAVTASGCAVFDRGADGAWSLASVTVEGRSVRPVDGFPITLSIERGAVSGSAGCNEYAIEADVAAGRFVLFEARDLTDGLCAGEVMEIERIYWAALQRGLIYAVADDQLEIEGEGTVIRFSRATGR